MIDVRDAMRAVLKHRKGDLVVSTEMAVLAWADVSDDWSLDIGMPSMSKGSSMALGMALAQPDRRVIVWDGDGGLLMNLGSLVTIAGKAPANLYHIVLDNGMYATTGGQRVPNVGNSSFAALAKEAGYPRTYEFDNLEDWKTSVEQLLDEKGPLLIVLKSAPEFPNWSAPGNFPRFRSATAARAAMTGKD